MTHARTLFASSALDAAPRAVRGPVWADASNDPKAAIAALSAAFEGFKTRYEGNYQAAIDDINAKLAALGVNGAGLGRAPEDPQYTEIFASYFRSGQGERDLKDAQAQGRRQAIHAAMSVGTADAGGYLAPTEWDRKVREAQTAKSPMRRLASVQVTTVGAYTTLWNDGVIGSGWVGETAARPETTTPGLDPITFGHGEIYANPSTTQRLLDDADMDVEGWLATQVEKEFNAQEGIAFLSGNGTNKPYGLLAYVTGGAAAAVHPAGVIASTTVAGTTAITGDELVTFTYSLAAPYRQNASWLMNSATAANIAKLKDGDGNYLWRESFLIGQPATLLGRPVEIDENMPNMTTGAYPIVYGDFKAGYLINDRTGIRVLRDPFTNKPYVSFYSTKRVGGGVLDPNAFRLVKMA